MPQFFTKLPDTSRLWLFPLRAALPEPAAQKLRGDLERFIESWQAHKQQLLAAVELLQNQVIAVAADEAQVGASGCSIDKLTKAVERIAREDGLDIVRASEVLFEEGGAFRAVPRADFQKLVRSGEIRADTTVFDNTIANLTELRAGSWRKSFKDSWHARAFPA